MDNQITESYWDLDRDGLSYSALCKWIVCRERFRLHYVEGLREEKTFNAPMEYGSLFHVCLESLAEHGYSISLQKKLWLEDLEKYRLELVAKYPTDIDQIALWVAITVVQFEQYLKRWIKSDSKKKYTHQEFEFHHKYRLLNGKKLTLHGYYDAVYQDGDENILQENKTKGKIDEQALNDTLSQNTQTMIYGIALQDQLGKYPDGSLYNVIRRPGLRQSKKESTTEFLLRIEKDIVDRPDHYFLRINTAVTPGDFKRFKREVLTPLLTSFSNWWESIKNNPFDPWNVYNATGYKIGRNPEHYRRPFGVYDSLAGGFQGDFFELLAKGSTYGLKRTERKTDDTGTTKQVSNNGPANKLKSTDRRKKKSTRKTSTNGKP